MPKTILITGNPVDGFNYVGPFDDNDAAIAFAEDNIHHEEWWVAELMKPEDLRDDAALEENEPRRLKCRFHPQAWINGYAADVDPEGPTEWEMAFPPECVIPLDDSYDTDRLRYAAEAPQWVKHWSGPFYVEIVNRDELEGRS